MAGGGFFFVVVLPFAIPAATWTRVLAPVDVDERRGAAFGCRRIVVVVEIEVERERAGWLPPVARHGLGRPAGQRLMIDLSSAAFASYSLVVVSSHQQPMELAYVRGTCPASDVW